MATAYPDNPSGSPARGQMSPTPSKLCRGEDNTKFSFSWKANEIFPVRRSLKWIHQAPGIRGLGLYRASILRVCPGGRICAGRPAIDREPGPGSPEPAPMVTPQLQRRNRSHSTKWNTARTVVSVTNPRWHLDPLQGWVNRAVATSSAPCAEKFCYIYYWPQDDAESFLSPPPILLWHREPSICANHIFSQDAWTIDTDHGLGRWCVG